MKKNHIIVFTFLTSLVISFMLITGCSSEKTQPIIPKYELINIDTPSESLSGRYAIGDIVRYCIYIPKPLQEDSLIILQNYFKEMALSEYKGIGRVCVFVYLNGMNTLSSPYATLLYDDLDKKGKVDIFGSTLGLDFVKEKLAGYEILGCWIEYRDEDYIICHKDNKFYDVIVDKKKQNIGELERLKTMQINGKTAFYSVDNKYKDYAIIEVDGLYCYDETGESLCVLSNDPLWVE